MNQCTQQDNTDTFQSLLYHIDDNNKFPARAAAAGPGYWNDLGALAANLCVQMLAVDETVILLHPPLPLVGVPIVMERGCQ